MKKYGLTPQNISAVMDAAKWARSKTTTHDHVPGTTDLTIELGLAYTHIELFKEETERLDKIRGEDFRKTFPELAPLLDL